MLRDRDCAYGTAVRERLVVMGIADVVASPRSLWQSAYVERVIGSIRRECLDHAIVFGKRHLRRLLAAYVAYYHSSRSHLSLAKDVPLGRPVQSIDDGNIAAIPQVGGLYHRDERRLAACATSPPLSQQRAWRRTASRRSASKRPLIAAPTASVSGSKTERNCPET